MLSFSTSVRVCHGKAACRACRHLSESAKALCRLSHLKFCQSPLKHFVVFLKFCQSPQSSMPSLLATVRESFSNEYAFLLEFCQSPQSSMSSLLSSGIVRKAVCHPYQSSPVRFFFEGICCLFRGLSESTKSSFVGVLDNLLNTDLSNCHIDTF